MSCIEYRDKYKNCVKQNEKIKMEKEDLDAQIKRLKGEIAGYQEEIDKHKSKVDTGDCQKYTQKISELEHELGECNVEWGACQQEGKQKDALDKKRIKEIEDQKRKFELCNKQLKDYKQRAKENKR